MFGKIDILEQKELTAFPQKAASAWTVMNDIVGASYKPIAYVGTQLVKGVNHFFLAEQTIITRNPERHITLVNINEFDGIFKLVAVERII